MSIHTTDGFHKHHYELEFYDAGNHPPHVHHYEGITSYDAGHRHRLAGITDPAPSGVEHVHYYKGTTTFNDGHVHHFAGATGPAIPLSDGRHYHLIEGQTTVDAGPEGPPHSHAYQGKAN